MENLTKAIDSLKIEDVEVVVKEPVSTSIEPTEAEIIEILDALTEGKNHMEVKKTVRRIIMDGEKQVSAQGFSLDQIKEIDDARIAKIAELTPVKEEVIKE